MPAAAIVLMTLLLGIVPVAARRGADWLWYRELGFERIFLTKIVAQWALGLTAGVVALVVLYLNARIALRDLPQEEVPAVDRARGGPRTRTAFLTRLAQSAAPLAAVLLALLLALFAASEWKTLVQFFYRTPFGSVDPVFGRDVAFYVFTLPAVAFAIDWLALLLVFVLVAIAWPVYLARGDVHLRRWRVVVKPIARVHFAVLAALLLVVVALHLWFVQLPSLLVARHGPLAGASYTDLHVRMPVLKAMSILALVAAVAILWWSRRGRFARSAGTLLGGYVVLAVLLMGLVPALVQRIVVLPNELAREAPQIHRHIEATRRAWGLERVESRELSGEQRLTLADIAANQATIDNVRLWDRDPLLQTFGQLQSIRTYYDFVSVDEDRYRVNGELRHVQLSARELSSQALPTRTFINEHLTFTHGMGLTLGPSNQVTDEGLPVLWIKDLPPASSVPIRVTRPQIYFGELANDFVLAPTRQREFDFPAGQGDAESYSSYDGTAGVPLDSFWRRLLFAVRFRSLNILLTSQLTPETRILFYRNVRERAQRAFPFLRFDSDEYLVVSDSGRLEWILDAYTTTNRYPYAQSIADGTNYMRNSVKVVVDAYDGDATAYLADPADPMIRTLAKIYPGMLHPLDEMPADIRAHIRYPGDLFRAQTALYATFHMDDAETFYHREDQWQIPATRQNDREEGFVRHLVMRLPGEREPEFILMRPFTPRQKDNLAAWMVARNDGPDYGKLIVYRFPRQSLVFGPRQIVSRIDQDTEVARQVSLWDQRGSEVLRGELLVIPIEESLIYVQPLYLRASGGRIPELKRVVVVHEGRVVMDESLEAGLARLFGGEDARSALANAAAGRDRAASEGAPPQLTSAQRELLRSALQHYERARAAQRADDWATYGAEMRQLGELLQKLNEPRE
jgi:uncharacterized membrane protein (UPF0182 family)